jgi:hypothetical protein
VQHEEKSWAAVLRPKAGAALVSLGCTERGARSMLGNRAEEKTRLNVWRTAGCNTGLELGKHRDWSSEQH